ncbi:MAG: AAA family ATPase [Acidobacteria bacterium]|nr:AAA family ATPase [Acidobacteriota bacterium]MBI3422138.1 AAA family ATPase [Acidobacteriota bacterium]
MRLHELWISDYKNLKDFRIHFDADSPITVIVGWNGTGKSNLFEALVIIFRDLDLNQATPFAYKIKYTCHTDKVEIDYDPARPGKERLKATVTPLVFTLEGEKTKKEIPKPAFVFGYYSGPSNRFKEHFLEHQRRYYEAILNAKEATPAELRRLKSLRRLFYAETHHSKYVLLAFFLKRDEKIDGFLREYLRIEGLDGLESVLFVMKEPSWTGKEGDPRFWNARGLVQKFLDKLFSVSLAPMRLSQNLPTGIKKRSRQELLYLYVQSSEKLAELAQDYETPSDFFASLESADLSEVIHDVIIKVKIRNHDGTLTFRELSEGEQQLLMVLGLMRFTKEKESLILLDEPDTHLNPFWSTEYLDLIKRIVDDEESSEEPQSRHILMSTHDPLVIAGLEREQIQIFKRDQETDRCYAEIPDRSPRGMGFEGVLTSDMFGFRSALDKPTLEKLDKKRQLTIKDHLSPDEQRELEKLNQQIGELDFTNVVRDDYYRLFAREMAKYEAEHEMHERVLTPAQREAREKFAKELVARLKRQQKKEDEQE